MGQKFNNQFKNKKLTLQHETRKNLGKRRKNSSKKSKREYKMRKILIQRLAKNTQINGSV